MPKSIIGEPVKVAGRTLPLSRAVRAGDFIFLSGVLPVRDGVLVEGDIGIQTRAALEATVATLSEAGAELEDVVKVTVWLTDRADFNLFNEAYGEFFAKEPPARSTVVSGLMLDAKIEIEVVAYQPE